MPRYLTVEQAAEVLACHPETVRRMLRAGQLAGRKLGGPRGAWRVALASLEAVQEAPPSPRPARPRPVTRALVRRARAVEARQGAA